MFDRYNILNDIEKHGHYKILAEKIKAIKEPRLMAKFDHHANLPEIFIKNNLTILPITRGCYIIGHFKTYHKLEQYVDDIPIQRMCLPEYLQSIDVSRITSEAMALNCAYASGIIDDFLNENKVIPSVSGRSGSGAFDFIIDIDKKGINNGQSTQNISVSKSQIEIDAGYEGKNSLALIEAKLDLSEDFLIRQLYYPYRVWNCRIEKPVRSIFFVYSNGVYHLYEYLFQDLKYYNSLKLIKYKKYSIENTDISVADIKKILQKTDILNEPKTPFPQADKFERVINICELLAASELNTGLRHFELTTNYAFTSRQTDYYTNAAIYLGLIKKDNSCYVLTDIGKSILKLGYKRRQLELCTLILQHKIFNSVLKEYFKNNKIMPPEDRIIEIMQNLKIDEIYSDNTLKRRSYTVKKWIKWIINLTI